MNDDSLITVEDIRKFFLRMQKRYNDLAVSIENVVKECKDRIKNLPENELIKEQGELMRKLRIQQALSKRTKLELEVIVNRIEFFLKEKDKK